MTTPPRPTPQKPAKPCPICGKPADPTHTPFCSPRCRTIDLGRWFNEEYALPSHPLPDESDESGPD